jgi:hypothetical protein
MKRVRSGYTNMAADKIWNDHIGNNAFVRHRDACSICLKVYKSRVGFQLANWCLEGDRIFDEMIDEVYAQIEDVLTHQN